MATLPANPTSRERSSLSVPWFFWAIALAGDLGTLAIFLWAPDSDQAFGAAILGIGFVLISTITLAIVVLVTTHNFLGRVILGAVIAPFALTFAMVALRAPEGVFLAAIYATMFGSPVAVIALTPVVLIVEARRLGASRQGRYGTAK